MRILWNIMFKLGLLFNKQKIVIVLVQKKDNLATVTAYKLDNLKLKLNMFHNMDKMCDLL